MEVMRPNRQGRRLQGRSDPLDAYQATESVLADLGTATPKARDASLLGVRLSSPSASGHYKLLDPVIKDEQQL